MINKYFQPRRESPPNQQQKSMTGFWATPGEREQLRHLAKDRGFFTVADYFRALIRDDIDRNGEP